MNVEELKKKRAELDALIEKAEQVKKLKADIGDALDKLGLLDLGRDAIVGALIYAKRHPELQTEIVSLGAATVPAKSNRGRKPKAVASGNAHQAQEG